jgi:acetylornithine deacetylase/succinyl-diaminopimelate desuccinylase-like protein
VAAPDARLESALAHAAAQHNQDLDDLVDVLRIPSVSTLPERREDCLRSARWLRERFERMGLRSEVVDVLPQGLPVVLAESETKPGRPHLTIYGHYDVQPPDPLEEWKSPPFEPEVRDGHLWARGAADNKGNHMVAVKAVEHLVATGELPVNVRFLIEGEEEISGRSLPTFLRDRGAQLKTDAAMIWDSGFDEEGRPSLAISLRGLLYTELHASGSAVDLHSGTYGGVAPNPINTLARVIGELKDRHGHVTIPGFYDNVRKPSPEEAADWQKMNATFTDAVMHVTGARALEGEEGVLAVERAGARPTLDVNGILGGFVGKGQKTVIPARAMAKVSMRLVSDQDPDAIFEAFVARVQELTTPGVEIEVRRLSSAPPVTNSADNAASRALRAAFEETFGKETALVREGGSIPVAVDFQEAVGAPLVISGIHQADCALHSPNEHLAIDNYHRGIEALIRFMCRLGGA